MRNLVQVLCKLIPVGVVAAGLATVLTAAGEPPLPKPTTDAASAVTGSFTGEYANGVPVYRLPSVSVTASRKEELAKIAEEDRLAALQRKQLRQGTQVARADSSKPSPK